MASARITQAQATLYVGNAETTSSRVPGPIRFLPLSGKRRRDLDRVVDDLANPIGGSKVTLSLDITGDGFEIVEPSF